MPAAVSVKVLYEVAGLGENAAVTPLGRPVTERLTLPEKPYCGGRSDIRGGGTPLAQSHSAGSGEGKARHVDPQGEGGGRRQRAGGAGDDERVLA